MKIGKFLIIYILVPFAFLPKIFPGGLKIGLEDADCIVPEVAVTVDGIVDAVVAPVIPILPIPPITPEGVVVVVEPILDPDDNAINGTDKGRCCC